MALRTLSTGKVPPSSDPEFRTLTRNSVLNPGDAPFNREDLQPAADAADRLAFPDASSVAVSELPFSIVSYETDDTSYTTPALLQTLAAVDVGSMATATEDSEGTTMPTETGEPTAMPTAGGNRIMAGGMVLVAIVASVVLI